MPLPSPDQVLVLVKIDTIDVSLTRLTKKKRVKTNKPNTKKKKKKKKRRNNNWHHRDTKQIIEYCPKLYINKFQPKEMDKFLET